ncbi:MAG: hypothetical protein K2X44_04690 [Magnetospirillum sp.]|nr:hypothetical protein [Magnetospirillum sp.]
MAESLRARLGAAFTLVPEGQPADFIIAPTFESFRFSLDDDNQAAKGALIGVLSIATTQPAAVTDLEMRLELVDAWGKPAASVRTKGHGVSRGTAMGFNMERSMTISASAAISQASSKAVHLLINDPAFQVVAAGRR